MTGVLAEKDKWDQYYSGLPLTEEDHCTAQFNQQLVDRICELQPSRGRILEAGSGGGWQSLALARAGFEVTLADFSPVALDYAKRLFQRENVAARFVQVDFLDSLAAVQPEFDVVFNAGVLEHYGQAEAVRFLRAMAAHSKRYVLVQVPNRRCYWYWLWRVRLAGRGEWQWGREVPVDDLADLFEAAGVRLLGHSHFGESWTESFISSLGLDGEVTRQLLEIHRSNLVPPDQQAYLVAALGSVREDGGAPAGWRAPDGSGGRDIPALSAALADALAAHLQLERRAGDAQAMIQDLAEKLTGSHREVAAERARELEQQKIDTAARRSLELHLADLRAAKSSVDARLASAGEQIQSAGLERAALSADAARLTSLLSEQGKKADAKWETIQKQEASIAALRLERDRLVEENEAGQRNLRDARRLLDEAQAVQRGTHAYNERMASAASQIGPLSDCVRGADALRRRTLAAISDFSAQFHDLLERVRKQRAWRLMLAARKAYTLLLRGGWRRSEVRRAPLEAFDLSFPDVWRYMPEGLHRPSGPHDLLSRGHEVANPNSVTFRFDVIILPIFDFEFRFQRPQQIACHFAREGHRVYWVSPSRVLEEAGRERYQTTLLRENLWEVRLAGAPMDLYGGSLSEESASILAGHIQQLAADEGLSAGCTIAQFPFWRKVCLSLRDRLDFRVVYDMMDDWQNWPTEPLIGPANLDEERRLLTDADVLTVSARQFAQRHLDNPVPPLLVPNGADFEFFHQAEPHPQLADLDKPVIGYYGAIAAWFDLELVESAARSRPGYSFVLIGQVHAVDVTSLRSLPNVHFLGEKNYRELPSYLQVFDVCLIPFRLNELTRAVDPVKLYEYLSQGKPVVATPMDELAPHADLLYLAEGEEEFLAAMDRALAEDGASRERRVEFARANTWTTRGNAITEAVAATFPLISILIVTYNSREFVEALWESIRVNTAYPRYEVIFADNASTDGTAEALHALAVRDPRIRVLTFLNNLGFAGGNNAAAREAKGEYLVFLNPDVMVTRGWLGRLIRPLRLDPSIGMVAPVTNFSGNETKVNFDYGNSEEMERFAASVAVEHAGQLRDLDVAPLLCAAISSSLWQEVGTLDERFEVGMFEDDDYSWRITQAGKRVVAAEDCFLHHFGNGAFAKLPTEDSLRIFEANRGRFEEKWRTTWKPHQLRPGARPLSEERRFSVAEFLQGGRSDTLDLTPYRPVLKKLHPDATVAGQPVNPQLDGSAAIAVACENATPGTSIRFGDTLLHTSYGSSKMLSATLPPHLFAHAGFVTVTLLNDLGESNALPFVVAPPERKN